MFYGWVIYGRWLRTKLFDLQKITGCIFEGDYASIIQALTKEEDDYSVIGPLVNED